MAFFEKLRDVETKYALNFIGFVLAILFGSLSVYQAFFQKTNPHLRFEVLSTANVFDIREDVGKLDVIFNGVNLREKQQTLALVTVRISNDGAAPIQKTAYDDTAQLGMEVSGGEITKVELLGANNAYLTEHLAVRIATPSSITISPVIIEPGDNFSLKLLVLHNERTMIDLKPLGKVAGIKEITLIGINAKQVPPSFWGQVFAGSVWVQIARAICYFLAVPLALILIFAPLAIISEYIEKQKRLAKLADFRKTTPLLRQDFEWLLNTYVEHGVLAVLKASKLINRPELIPEALRKNFDGIYVGRRPDRWVRHELTRDVANKLLLSKVVTQTDSTFKVDEAFREFVNAFQVFVVSGTTLGEMTHVQTFYGGGPVDGV
ncbi:MAG TPA: hypothetical protein VFA77_13330 [Candidatus Eisenbacteria bacterium]|nr:hypothetical protein [Candidatus Eisenbacteria bacterium]